MSTYGQLKTEVLTLVASTGSTEVGTVVESALVSCVKYIAAQTDLPKLIKKKAYTVIGADITAGLISITSGSKINATDFSTPNRLYVQRGGLGTFPGTPYEILEYMHYYDLASADTAGIRDSLYEARGYDLRPTFSATITPDSELIIDPIAEGDIINFFYMVEPAAYGTSTVPEVPAEFHYILVNGATMVAKEWIREPEEIIDPHTIFKGLDKQIEKLDLYLHGRRKRSGMKVHHSYWARR